MRVLALDAATCTGFAVDRPGSDPADAQKRGPITGTFRCWPKGQAIGEDNHAHAATNFKREVRQLIAIHQPDHVCIEAPVIRDGAHGAQTAMFLMGLVFMTDQWLFEEQLAECSILAIGTVRKAFTGNGAARDQDGNDGKERVAIRCRQLGWSIESPDARDAAALWWVAKTYVDPAFKALAQRRAA